MRLARISTFLVHAAVRAKLAAYDYSWESESLPADRSIICVGTHACSLDAWIAFDLTRRLWQRRFMHLGDEAIMVRFPILRQFGVMPVSVTDPMLTMRSLSAAGKALRTNSDIALWIFPTGDQIPSGSGIGTIRPGLQALARLAGDALVVPVGIYYYVYQQPRISAWVHLGTPLGSARNIARANWSNVSCDASEALAAAVREAATRVLAEADKARVAHG